MTAGRVFNSCSRWILCQLGNYLQLLRTSSGYPCLHSQTQATEGKQIAKVFIVFVASPQIMFFMCSHLSHVLSPVLDPKNLPWLRRADSSVELGFSSIFMNLVFTLNRSVCAVVRLNDRGGEHLTSTKLAPSHV